MQTTIKFKMFIIGFLFFVVAVPVCQARFTDMGDGTINDNNTGLIWLKDANCFGAMNWYDAMGAAATLDTGECGLSDSSIEGDWRLPTKEEFEALIDLTYYAPTLSNTDGTGQWTEGDAFSNLQHNGLVFYWMSAIFEGDISNAWFMHMGSGVAYNNLKTYEMFVWPVRVQGNNTYYHDEDGDGSGDPLVVIHTDEQPYGFVENNTDCDDGNALIYTGATEICDDGIDSNCNGNDSESEPLCKPRFTDMLDGTVKDNQTDLVWLKDANCFSAVNWYEAMDAAATLETGECGLLDNSSEGDWRLPTQEEFEAIVNKTYATPALSNTVGTGQWTEGDAFNNVQGGLGYIYYWSSTIYEEDNSNVWFMHMASGVMYNNLRTFEMFVWPVRVQGNNTYYHDEDGDGYGDPLVVIHTDEQPYGFVENNTDCDDGNPAVNPDLVWYLDSDGDGYGGASATTTSCLQPAGYQLDSTDCNDGDINVTELIWYHDSDGDGYGDPNDEQNQCVPDVGYVADNTDCDDDDSDEHPDQIWYLDSDGDGYGDIDYPYIEAQCLRPNGYVADNTDCNDDDMDIYPKPWYLDSDGDTYGDFSIKIIACEPPSGYVLNKTDCDDTDAYKKPGQTWYRDADGDGYGVSGYTSTRTSCQKPSGFGMGTEDCDDTDPDEYPGQIWYMDSDGDGYGNPAVTNNTDCERPGIEYLSAIEMAGTDCDDGQLETTHGNTYYRDFDGDGYGDDDHFTVACTQPAGFVVGNTDCDDNNSDKTDDCINPNPASDGGSGSGCFIGTIIN